MNLLTPFSYEIILKSGIFKLEVGKELEEDYPPTLNYLLLCGFFPLPFSVAKTVILF